MFKKLLLLFALFSVTPAMCMEQDIVTIQTQDEQEFQIEVRLAILSETLKDLIEDAGIDNPIPLLNITAATWQLIQDQLEYVYQMNNNANKANTLSLPIYAACKNLDGQQLIDLINAVNYLDIPQLLRIAKYIATQSIEKILPEQLAQLTKEIRNPIVFLAVTNTLKLSPDTYFSQCDSRGRMLGKQLEPWDGNYQGEPICLTHDKKKIVLGGFNGKHFCVLDLKTKKIVTSKRKLIAPEKVCVTPDNKRIVSRSRDNTIRVWDIDTGKLLKSWKVVAGEWLYFSLCATNKSVLVSDGSYIEIWDIETSKLLRRLNNSECKIKSLWGISDNNILVVLRDFSIAIYSLESFEFLAMYKGHTNWVSSVCITADNKKIVSSSADKTIRVWDIETGELLVICKGHTDWVSSVCVTSDNKRVLSSSWWDKTIRVWDIETGRPLTACRDEHTLKLSFLCALENNKFISGYSDGTIQEWDISARTMWLSTEQVKQIWGYLRNLLYHLQHTKLDPPCPGVSKKFDKYVCRQYIQKILDGNMPEQKQENDSLQSQAKRVKMNKREEV